MLVVDDTVSMQRTDPNKIASLALQKFVERIPGEGSRIGIATYDDDILTSTSSLANSNVDQPPNPMIWVFGKDNKDALKEYAGRGVTQKGNFTDLPNALYYAVQQINGLTQRESSKAIIAVSDGENDFINTTAKDESDKKLELVKDAGIPVYLIVINASDTEGVEDYMKDIADETGGDALFVDSGDEIDTFLVNIANKIYGYQPDTENIYNNLVGPEPEEWKFPLTDGIFEANLEVTHTRDLEMELFGPNGTIPLEGNKSVEVSSIPDRDNVKTIIRLMEPDPGDYVMRLSSQISQSVTIQIILNNEIYIQVDLSPDPAVKGSAVQVTAKVMRGGEQYTDLEFADLEASVSVDGGPSMTMDRDNSTNAFCYELTAPDQKDAAQVVVTVRGQKSFLRSSDPAELKIDLTDSDPNPPNSGPNPLDPGPNPPDPDPGSELPIWVIIAAIVLLAVLLVIVAVLAYSQLIGRSKRHYIRLSGTLVVTYLNSSFSYIWGEKYVCPGGYYTKQKPCVSLGRMLRDQQKEYHEYYEIPDYFDKIQIGGVQYKGGRLCVEITGEFDAPSGLQKINKTIDIENGKSVTEMGMDDMHFDAMPGITIEFPDGNQTNLTYQP